MKKKPSKISKLLCIIGIHRPLYGHKSSFRDIVSGKQVYESKCPCGKHWLVDSPYSFLGFKAEIKNYNDKDISSRIRYQ